MAETGTREDPYRAYNFMVEIDGVTLAGFSEVTGVSTDGDVISYREGADIQLSVRQLPGLRKFANIVCKRGYTTNRELWQWRKNILDGREDRRNGAIVLLSETRERVMEWRFQNAWPSKYDGASLNAGTSEVAVETIEFCHEGLSQT
jgi:phage tail-like protein